MKSDDADVVDASVTEEPIVQEEVPVEEAVAEIFTFTKPKFLILPPNLAKSPCSLVAVVLIFKFLILSKFSLVSIYLS